MLFRIAAATMALGVCVLLFEASAVAGLIDFHRIRSVFSGDGEEERSVDFLSRPRDVLPQAAARALVRPASQQHGGDVQSPHPLAVRADVFDRRPRLSQPVDLTRADIALVGDSYIEGAYVSDQETAAVRLQEQLGQPVANLGVSGYGSLQELKVIEKHAVPLGPKMVAWFFFEGNDLDDDQDVRERDGLRTGRPRTARHAQSPRRRNGGSRRAIVHEQRVHAAQAMVGSPGAQQHRQLRLVSRSRWHLTPHVLLRLLRHAHARLLRAATIRDDQAAFRRGAEICRQHGIRLVAVYIPIKFRVYGGLCTYPAGSPCVRWKPWTLEAQFAAFSRSAGIEFLSLTEPMQRAAAAGHVVYAPEDSHWSAEGHRFVAGRSQIGNLVTCN